jgi:hypothetical protein
MNAMFRQLDPRPRRLLVAGNLSLALAMVLWNFRQYLGAGHAWYDGVYGFFFGISIGLNLMGVLCARRCRRSQV